LPPPILLARLTEATGKFFKLRLLGFQTDFAFLLGTSFADADHAAALEHGRVFIEDKLDHLAAPRVETSAAGNLLSRNSLTVYSWKSPPRIR
jgi:hypothetical protein